MLPISLICGHQFCSYCLMQWKQVGTRSVLLKSRQTRSVLFVIGWLKKMRSQVYFAKYFFHCRQMKSLFEHWRKNVWVLNWEQSFKLSSLEKESRFTKPIQVLFIHFCIYQHLCGSVEELISRKSNRFLTKLKNYWNWRSMSNDRVSSLSVPLVRCNNSMNYVTCSRTLR